MTQDPVLKIVHLKRIAAERALHAALSRKSELLAEHAKDDVQYTKQCNHIHEDGNVVLRSVFFKWRTLQAQNQVQNAAKLSKLEDELRALSTALKALNVQVEFLSAKANKKRKAESNRRNEHDEERKLALWSLSQRRQNH